MTAAFAPMLPHSALRPLNTNLWMVTGSLKGRHMPRNMVVYKMKDGTLLIHSAIALDDAGFAALEALGRPSVLIVPNGFHRMDAERYKARYPSIKVLCPVEARAAVEKVLRVEASCEDALPQLGVIVHGPAGIKPAELIYELAVPGGFVLVTTDLMMNLPGLPGMDGLMLYLFGPGKHFGITRIAKMLLVRDKVALRDWLRGTAARPGLMSILVAHCEPIDKDVSAALLAAAGRL